MMHFFIRPKIHIDAFTYRRDVIEYAPIVNGIEAIPEWWKKLPKTAPNSIDDFFPSATMKTCVGMRDYYHKSIAMPLWSDIYIDVLNDTYRWQFADERSNAVAHPEVQFNGFLNRSEYGNLKIKSPWLLVTKSDLNWIQTQPIYNREELKNYSMAQGLLNFKLQHTANIQMFLDLSTDRQFVIPFNSVFLFTPLSDKKVVVHRHLITQEQFNSKEDLSAVSTRVNKYNLHNKLPKCPYKDNIK
jgi:hypothetical protein